MQSLITILLYTMQTDLWRNQWLSPQRNPTLSYFSSQFWQHWLWLALICPCYSAIEKLFGGSQQLYLCHIYLLVEFGVRSYFSPVSNMLWITNGNKPWINVPLSTPHKRLFLWDLLGWCGWDSRNTTVYYWPLFYTRYHFIAPKCCKSFFSTLFNQISH